MAPAPQPPIDQVIEQHFASQRIREILVPEWGVNGTPLIIHAGPITVGELQQIRAAGKEDSLEFLAKAIVLKARNEDGKRLFGRGDLKTLMEKADAWTVQRVALEILDTETPKADDLLN